MQLKSGSTRAAALCGAVLSCFATARGQSTGAETKTEAEADAAAPSTPASSSLEGRASVDAAAYADSDHVYVLTPSVSASIADPVAGFSLDGHYLVDVVSAASVDIVSTASQRWVEVRHAGGLDVAYKPGDFGVALDGVVSSEPDYLSWSAGATLTQDLMQQNLTLLLGVNHGHDIAGRSGTPFSVFSRPLDRESVKAGLTLVLDDSTIASLLADLVFESGDPSKPYRYVPLFAPGTQVPRGASVDEVNALRLAERPLERLPDSRNRYALTLRLAHRFSGSTLRVDERLYTDSWSLHASSTDARYLIDLGRRWRLGPHLRVHAQTPVSFWRRAYVLQPGFDYPALRTGDRELGPLLGLTLGFTVRLALGSDEEPDAWSLGLDVNATDTRYFDDLYISERLSALAALSLEVAL